LCENDDVVAAEAADPRGTENMLLSFIAGQKVEDDHFAFIPENDGTSPRPDVECVKHCETRPRKFSGCVVDVVDLPLDRARYQKAGVRIVEFGDPEMRPSEENKENDTVPNKKTLNWFTVNVLSVRRPLEIGDRDQSMELDHARTIAGDKTVISTHNRGDAGMVRRDLIARRKIGNSIRLDDRPARNKDKVAVRAEAKCIAVERPAADTADQE
jgi:hypothetical protein